MNNHRSGKLFKLFLRNRKKNIARCRAKLLYINWKVEVIKEFSIHNFISMSPSIFFNTFWVLDGRELASIKNKTHRCYSNRKL